MLAQFGIDVPAGRLWARSDGLGDSDSHVLKIGPTTSLRAERPPTIIAVRPQTMGKNAWSVVVVDEVIDFETLLFPTGQRRLFNGIGSVVLESPSSFCEAATVQICPSAEP